MGCLGHLLLFPLVALFVCIGLIFSSSLSGSVSLVFI